MKRRNFLWYSLLFVAGCSSAINQSLTFPEKLRFAVTDVQGLEPLERDYSTFKIALEEALDTKIEFFSVENFTAAAPALLSNQVDLVLAGPSEYIILNARAKAIPIVSITRPEYHSVIVVRGDSQIKSLEQLKGKTIAMRSVGSTAGYLGINKLLMDAGLQPQSDFQVVILGDEGMKALQNGEVDACGLSSFGYEIFLSTDGSSEKDFPVIATGADLPNDVFVVNYTMNAELVEEMRSRMLSNKDKLIQALLTNEFFVNRFKNSEIIEAYDSDYESLRKVYQAIGQGEFL